MFNLPVLLHCVASQVLLKVLCTRKRWLLGYKLSHLKNSLYSKLVFNWEYVFSQTQYAKHWIGPLDNSTDLFKLNILTHLPHHIICFSNQCQHGCTIAQTLLWNFKFLFWNYQLWMNPFWPFLGVGKSKKTLCSWYMGRDKYFWGGVLLPSQNWVSALLFLFPLLNAVTSNSQV